MKRKPIKKISDRGRVVQGIINLLREDIKKKKGEGCEVCGRLENVGLHHVLERSRCPRLIVHRENLILLCWNCHFALHRFTKNHPQYKRVEERLEKILGKDYENYLLTLDKMQGKISITYLKTYYLALKQEK